MNRIGKIHPIIGFYLIPVALLLSGCTGIPRGIEPVRDLEPERYLGTWYSITRLDHSFERGLSRVTARYEARDDGGIRVINRGYDPSREEWREVDGVAYFIEEPNVGRLKVSFFGPFYGGYNIIALDRDDYRYAMVTGPTRSYLWILSRTPELDEAIIDELITKAADLGFAVDELIFVEQDAG